MNKVSVVKKDGTHEDFDSNKIIIAVTKSANRALSPLTDEEKSGIIKYVEDYISNYQREEITVPQMHNLVESALEFIKPEVAKSYRDYRNYKTDFVEMINGIYKKAQSIMYRGDKENSNTDSALTSTKRSLIFNQLNKELYQKFFMTTEELQACRDGFIYIHDMSARRDTMNCFSRETQFIYYNEKEKRNGITSFLRFNDGDEIIVPTVNGNHKKAIVHSYGKQKLNSVTFRLNYSITTTRIVRVTPNHRWILADDTETTELKVGDVLKEHNCTQWTVDSIKKDKEEEVWCLEVEDDHNFFLVGWIPTGNCCLSDISNILDGGFEMGNMFYNEPKSLDTAFDVIGDVVLSAASQQYGGFTIPRADEILSKYAKLSFEGYKEERYNELTEQYKEILPDTELSEEVINKYTEKAEEYAYKKVYRDMEQGFQGWEYKFNTVASSRGDYPFTTITIGVGKDKFSKMATKACLRVRANGQGEEGKKHVVLFPKIVFTYTDDLHGEGKESEDLFKEAIRCSSKAMYPDFLSLDGDTTVAEMWHKYGEIIAPINKPVAYNSNIIRKIA